jgi:hypothetical protein
MTDPLVLVDDAGESGLFDGAPSITVLPAS